MNFCHREETPYYPEHTILRLNREVYDLIGGGVTGSFNVLFARVLGLSYVDFLRFVRDNYGATLHGKKSTYISFSFDNKENARKFQFLMNDRWNEICHVREWS